MTILASPAIQLPSRLHEQRIDFEQQRFVLEENLRQPFAGVAQRPALGAGYRRSQALHAGFKRRALGRRDLRVDECRRQGFDVHAALCRHDHAHAAGGGVDQQGEVGFFRGVDLLFDADRVDPAAFDGVAEDGVGVIGNVLQRGGLADKARFAAAAGTDLSFDDPRAGRQRQPVYGFIGADQATRRNGDPVLRQQFLGIVFKQVHGKPLMAFACG